MLRYFILKDTKIYVLLTYPKMSNISLFNILVQDSRKVSD